MRVSLIILVIFSLILCIANPVLVTRAAVPFTDQGIVSIEGEPYIIDTNVIKDGSTFKMWYTHGQTSLSLSDLGSRIGALLTQDIIDDISNHDLGSLLSDLAALDVDDVFNLLNSMSTVIGYATSSDGVTWTVVNPSVLAGTGGGAWNAVGAPCVIKEGSASYKMWYTASKVILSKPDLQAIMDDLNGTQAERKQAIIDLMHSSTTSIRYATSSDGIIWSTSNPEVLAGSSGSLWDSTAAPSVINDAGTYKMWYTLGQTTLTGTDLDTILANLGSFGIDDFIEDVLSKTSTAIGYATSANGITWTVNPAAVLYGSGSVWDSIATPCVLKKAAGGYEMWYSRVQTDLTQPGIDTLVQDLLALTPEISSLMTTLQGGISDPFIVEFTDFIDNHLTAVKADLAHTSSVITYATSTDGITWEVQNSELFVGSALWNSVAAPCVILDSGVYRMWYMKGMAELTAQNIVDYLQGTISPVGYATGFTLVAETSYTLIKDTDNIIAIQLVINHAKSSIDGTTQPVPGGIASYQALLSYNPAGIEVIGVRGVAPFDTPAFDPATGIVSADATTPLIPSDSPIVKIIIRLKGSALTQYPLIITFQSIMSGGTPGMNVPAESAQTITFLRGDADGNGVVTIVDAMFLLQYASNNRLLSEVNPVNAASVMYDGASGDVISIVDAMFVLQFASNNRDINFQ